MRYTHGGSHTRLYSIWKSMKSRCYCPNWKPYFLYGARGITVCDEWRNSFEAFRNWALAHGYRDDLELDRMDVNGNYSPINCRWVSHYTQTINRRDTLYCVIDDTKIRLVDYCKERGLNRNTVNSWRAKGCLEEKLSLLEGRKVVISGGKKND